MHPYDHRDVVAGQATVGRELAAQAPDLDTVLVAVGGGGLAAGVTSWYQGDVEVVGVEPVSIPALHDALAAGYPVEVPVSGLAADSLGAKRIGAVPWACLQPHLRRVVLVTDEEIAAAQRRLWSALHLVAEPGGAAALAAVLSGAYVPAAGRARRGGGVRFEHRSVAGGRGLIDGRARRRAGVRPHRLNAVAASRAAQRTENTSSPPASLLVAWPVRRRCSRWA